MILLKLCFIKFVKYLKKINLNYTMISKSFFFVFLIFLILDFNISTAQSFNYNLREITVNTADSVIKASVINNQKIIKIDSNSDYFWYYNGTINHNRAGYSGKLLTGKCEVMDNQQRLISKGYFKYGLMNGVWNRWYANGNLMFSGSYKNGKLQGEAKYYNKLGNIKTSKSYCNGLLNGRSLFYFEDTIIIKQYKNGIEKVKNKKIKKNLINLNDTITIKGAVDTCNHNPSCSKILKKQKNKAKMTFFLTKER